MSNPNDPTADYRKYPEGPNFLGIVIGFAFAILVILAVTYFVLNKDGDKMIPHKANPHPDSMMQPLLPPISLPVAA